MLNLLTALSLLLCAAVVVLWLVPQGTWTFHTASRRYTARPQPGRLWLDVEQGQWINGEFGPPKGKFYRLAAGNRRRLPGGLEWVRNPASDPNEARWLWLFIPYWPLAAVTALPPAVWLVRATAPNVRKRREARLMLCPRCGYDLRATPERCPECGLEAERR